MDPQIDLLNLADIPKAMRLKDELGWNQTPADWRRFLDLTPGGCFAARRGSDLVGTAAAFVFDRVCWIGMVIVQQDARGGGLGRALMECCLQHARARGCILAALDATAAGEPLYSRLGFRPVGTVVGRAVPDDAGAEGAVGTAGAAGPASRSPASLPGGWRLRRLGAEELAAAEALEARAAGVRREPLLRLLLRQYPDAALACLDPGGALQGFVFWRPGLERLQVGPLIASDEGAAGALLDAGLAAARERGQAPALSVPADRPEVNRLLQVRGLRVEPRLTRMVLPLGGENEAGATLQGQPQLIYAFSGPEKG